MRISDWSSYVCSSELPALGPSRCRRSENDGEIADCIVARRDRTRPGCWQRSPPGLIRTNDIATPFAPSLQPANADGEREPKSRPGVLVYIRSGRRCLWLVRKSVG